MTVEASWICSHVSSDTFDLIYKEWAVEQITALLANEDESSWCCCCLSCLCSCFDQVARQDRFYLYPLSLSLSLSASCSAARWNTHIYACTCAKFRCIVHPHANQSKCTQCIRRRPSQLWLLSHLVFAWQADTSPLFTTQQWSRGSLFLSFLLTQLLGEMVIATNVSP